MVPLLLGICSAAAASTLYSLGIAVQALDARDVHEDHALRLSLLTTLVQRGRWLAGTGMTLLGWPLQVIALWLAPLVVVQPALATGLLVLLIAGQRILNEHAGRREWLAVGAIVLGVIGIAAVAPGRHSGVPATWKLLVTLGPLGLCATLPYVLRALKRNVGTATMLGAGFGYGWSGLATKILSDAAKHGHWTVAIAWALGSGVASGIAVVSEMSALQLRPAIQVAPVVFVVQTALPVALAPFLFHENYLSSLGSAIPLLGSFIILLGGAVVLARSPLLLALMAPPAEDATSEA